MDYTDLTLFIFENASDKNRDVVDYLNAILVPLIALLSLYIAYRQHKMDRQRFQHELYDRRIQIYKSIRLFLKKIMKKGSVSEEDAFQLVSSTTEASFFLSKKVTSKIDEIYDKSFELIKAEIVFSEDVGKKLTKDSKENAEKKNELLKWFITQFEEVETIFQKELKIKK